MKGLILLANHFEDIEALATIDCVRRAGVCIDTVSITGNNELITQYHLKVKADKLIEEIQLDDYDFLILPGGKAVKETHLSSPITKKCVEHFYKKDQLIACICAAPSILGQMGILDDMEFTCYPGCEEKMPRGKYLQDENVVVRKNIITAKAAGASFIFAYQIIAYIKGEEIAKQVLDSIYY